MNNVTIASPYENGFCKDCINLVDDNYGKYCPHHKGKFIRKISECQRYLPQKMAKLANVIEEMKNEEEISL